VLRERIETGHRPPNLEEAMAEKALVTLRSRPTEAEAAESAVRVPAARAGFKVEQTTPQGVLVSGDQQQLSALEGQGFRVKLLPETNILQVGNYRINIELSPPTLPSDLRLPAAESRTWTHHLVQLISPPTPEWIQELTAVGVTVVEPVGSYGLFVVAQPDVVEGLKARFPFVAWAGPFQPAYRLAPNLQGLQGEIRHLSVGVYPASEGPGVEAAIEAAGGTVVGSSAPAAHRGLYHRIVATMDAKALHGLARHRAVRWIEFTPDRPGLDGERECQILAGNLSATPPPNTAPLSGYRDWLLTAGVDGTGVTIAICDTGVDGNTVNNTSGHADLRGRQAAFVDYTNGAVLRDTEGHGTHVAGIAVGNARTNQIEPGAEAFTWGQGVAPEARFVNMNALFLNPWPPNDHARLTRDAVTNAAQVMNNSWFDSGPGSGYTANARRFDQLVRDPNPDSAGLDYLVIVFSAGNAGPEASTITGPKENKNSIVVGNSLTFRPVVGDTDDIRGVANSSSRGPALDGRLLPTVVAPGTDVASALSHFENDPFIIPISGTGVPDLNNPGQLINRYTFLTGTSMAAPHVAGACALVIQRWRAQNGNQNPSPAMVKAILVNTAEDCAGGPDGNGGFLAPIPNNNQGWGRVNLNNIFRDHPASSRGPRLYFDQDQPLTANGQERVVWVRAPDPGRPVRVTLAWTDAPGTANASPALVNDLDLEVTELATNQVFKGNVFADGFSSTGGAFDARNNIECVYIELPNGEYEVRVLASNLRADARPPYGTASPWQDYALVIDNAEVIQ
jgi:subtilisin family serine protease